MKSRITSPQSGIQFALKPNTIHLRLLENTSQHDPLRTRRAMTIIGKNSVLRILTLRAEGCTLVQITEVLNQESRKPRAGVKWYEKQIARNPAKGKCQDRCDPTRLDQGTDALPTIKVDTVWARNWRAIELEKRQFWVRA